MTRLKSDIKIRVTVRGKSFSIGAVSLGLKGKYLIKRGRASSAKMPQGTLTQVFAEARKFAVKHA